MKDCLALGHIGRSNMIVSNTTHRGGDDGRASFGDTQHPLRCSTYVLQ